jgi:hypothetical protein
MICTLVRNDPLMTEVVVHVYEYFRPLLRFRSLFLAFNKVMLRKESLRRSAPTFSGGLDWIQLREAKWNPQCVAKALAP